jgi:hypothetical protein
VGEVWDLVASKVGSLLLLISREICVEREAFLRTRSCHSIASSIASLTQPMNGMAGVAGLGILFREPSPLQEMMAWEGTIVTNLGGLNLSKSCFVFYRSRKNSSMVSFFFLKGKSLGVLFPS